MTTSPHSPAPRGLARLLLAYRVTLLCFLSYWWLRFRLRFASVAASEVLLREAHRRNARRILSAVSRLQGLFIKVGQLISIMTNVLPDEFRSELEGLQDRVPPRPYSDVEARFREEFSGRGPTEVFAEFSKEPVAAASIGQVHRARTRTGLDVAVKVQYPDIEEIVRVDLRALERIFGILHWVAPYHGMPAVFAEIRSMILCELDFRLEAQNLERIAHNFQGHPTPLPVGFPKVEAELSTSRILTTGWVEGVKIGTARLAELRIDRALVARTIVTAYCQQIFKDGLYHADPHPGNLLIVPPGSSPSDERPQIVFLDFGAVATLPPAMRRGIAEVLQASLRRDTPRLILAMKDMGFIARGADPEIFERVVDFFHDKLQAEVKLDSFSLRDIKLTPEQGLRAMADLRQLDVSLRSLMDHFHVPKEWILLERTLLLLLGLCTELDPQLEPMQIIRPYAEEFLLGEDRDWSKLLVETTRDVLTTALALPGDLRKFLGRAQRGQLEVGFRGLDDSTRLIYTLGHQIIYAAFAIAGLSAFLIFDGRDQEARAELAIYVTGAALFLLLWSMVTTGVKLSGRRRRR